MMAAAGSIRALGLDFGAKTVGVSASDALGVTAQGLEMHIITPEALSAEALSALRSMPGVTLP